MVYTFWRVGTLAFFTNYNYFEIKPACWMYQLFIYIVEYDSIVWIYHNCFFFSIYLVDIWVVSSFGLLYVKLLWRFVYKLALNNIPLHGYTSLSIRGLKAILMAPMNKPALRIVCRFCVDISFQFIWVQANECNLLGHIIRVCSVL